MEARVDKKSRRQDLSEDHSGARIDTCDERLHLPALCVQIFGNKLSMCRLPITRQT